MALKTSLQPKTLQTSLQKEEALKVKSVNFIIPTFETYNWPQPTGQTTEYATYDDAWQQANIWKPIFEAEAGKKRIVPRLVDFFTLVDNNSFGNKNRFTNENGEQNYNNDYVVDNYTGLGWKLTRITIKDSSSPWQEAIDKSSSLTILGFNDFYLPNFRILQSIVRYKSSNRGLNYSPFDNNQVNAFFSSTTYPRNSSLAEYYDNNGLNFRSTFKVTGDDWDAIPYRKHF